MMSSRGRGKLHWEHGKRNNNMRIRIKITFGYEQRLPEHATGVRQIKVSEDHECWISCINGRNSTLYEKLILKLQMSRK